MNATTNHTADRGCWQACELCREAVSRWLHSERRSRTRRQSAGRLTVLNYETRQQPVLLRTASTGQPWPPFHDASATGCLASLSLSTHKKAS